MAKGRKTGGRNFEKGHQFNKGVEKITSDDKQARELSTLEFMRIANKYLNSNLTELKQSMVHPDTTALEIIVIKIMVKAAEHGDQNRLEFILNRVLGKVPDKIDYSSKDGTMSGQAKVVITLPDNDRSKKD